MKCGLLGRKLAHSYSPAIHRAFFENGGGYDYELFEVEPGELEAFLLGGGQNTCDEGFSPQEECDAVTPLQNISIWGLNVTVPYKQEVMKFCRKFSPAATEIGSVNTMVPLSEGGFYGDNTDAAGFDKMLGGFCVKGHKVLVLGSGGSSLTVCHVLKKLNAGEIVVVALDDNNPDFLRKHGDTTVLVNTTPVGMYPGNGKSPVSLGYFPGLKAVFDLVYNPSRTRLMMDAEKRGVMSVGGLAMLVGQAAAASEIFTGAKISADKEAFVLEEIRRRMENIILVGMPGCGKTTIGQALAERLGRAFIDSDIEIEKIAGRSPSEIICQDGEDAFREIESSVLEKFGKESALVLATGGGCVTREENYGHLHQNGTILYIDRPIEELDREGRPLSQGDLYALHKKREPLYLMFSDIVVRNVGELDRVIDGIIDIWKCN